METTPSKDIPGLREHLVALAAVHSRMMIEMNNIYELCRHHGLLLDLKFEERNFPLGNSGSLMTSMVKAEAKAEDNVEKDVIAAVKAALTEADSSQAENKEALPTPIAEDGPTEIAEKAPAALQIKHNIVGHRLADVLRQRLNKDLMESAVGTLALRHFSDDLTSLPMDTLLKWPTGIYRHREDNAYQLLINTGKTEHGLVAVVVPRLYQLGGVISDTSDDQAFIVWKRNTEEEVRVLNDETPENVLNALLGPMVNMVDVCLAEQAVK